MANSLSKNINVKGELPGVQKNLAEQLAFARRLQAIANKIHETSDLNQILFGLVEELTGLFNSERFTIYLISEDKKSLVAKVKIGLEHFSTMTLPISNKSIAGYCALHKTAVNIKNAYDETEIRSYAEGLEFARNVDEEVKFKTKQLLAAPILNAVSDEIIGVLQIINSKTGAPFTEIMRAGSIALCKSLAIAFLAREKLSVKSKYGLLLERSAISATEMAQAKRSAARRKLDLDTVLLEEFNVQPSALRSTLEDYYGVPYQSVNPGEFSRHVLGSLSRDNCEFKQWVPIGKEGDRLIILATDPEPATINPEVCHAFPDIKVDNISYRVCIENDFTAVLNWMYPAKNSEGAKKDSVDNILKSMTEEYARKDGPVESATPSTNAVVMLFNKIIVDASEQGVSDIHIEPHQSGGQTRVRFRKDGELLPYVSIPAAYRDAFISRIKIMANLDVTEKRKPQDGKINFNRFGPLDIELRVATIPSQGGVEDVVLRILAAGEPVPMMRLGFSELNLAYCKEIIKNTFGVFLVCGPTGSGKTTTLHSILAQVNTPGKKIWTIEDPVEITHPGTRQVSMNVKTGLTFSTAMRAFLRSDPDVIMVGEMRDNETANLGISAALTGHLVMSTLHTNSAPDSITRLLDLGVGALNLADALLGILAQRLCRRLCEKCKKTHVATTEEVDLMLKEYIGEVADGDVFQEDYADESGALKIRAKSAPDQAGVLRADWLSRFGDTKGQIFLRAPNGCNACNGTGYKGRIALHELLVVTMPIKNVIRNNGTADEIRACALASGMRTLRQDGIEKVLSGHTDIKQIRAVCMV